MNTGKISHDSEKVGETFKRAVQEVWKKAKFVEKDDLEWGSPKCIKVLKYLRLENADYGPWWGRLVQKFRRDYGCLRWAAISYLKEAMQGGK